MTIKAFLKLVEIQTKVASIIPFLMGVVFTIYRYDRFNPITISLFFLSMICIDMATTAINNYMDFKRAKRREGYNYEVHNAIVNNGLSNKSVLSVIVLLITLGTIFGLGLFIMTDIVILAVGFVAFGIGIIYSFGPIPISRTPLGEIVSGIMMGGFIFFITIYSQIVDLGIIVVSFNNFILLVQVNIYEMFVIALVSSPLVFMIANIMLANNICDLEDDIINLRYTLPYFIGKKYAVILFNLIYYGSYVAILIAVIMTILPITSLITLLTIIPVGKNLKLFNEKQIKAETFVVSVKNFVLVGLSYILTLGLSLLIAAIL